jgi:hypothetical protein
MLEENSVVLDLLVAPTVVAALNYLYILVAPVVSAVFNLATCFTHTHLLWTCLIHPLWLQSCR